MHHHRINFDKYHPGYFGKLGMRNFHLNRNHNFCPSINLDKLWSLVGEKNRVDCKTDKEGKVPVVDLVQFVSIVFFSVYVNRLAFVFICSGFGNFKWWFNSLATGGLKQKYKLHSHVDHLITDSSTIFFLLKKNHFVTFCTQDSNEHSFFQGYYKLLGRGHLPKQPIIVKAKHFSKKAEERIKAAGGVCLLRA